MAKKSLKTTMTTRTGKTLLGPLNIAQLEKLLESARNKNKPKIQRRIAVLKSRPGYKAPMVETVESAD